MNSIYPNFSKYTATHRYGAINSMINNNLLQNQLLKNGIFYA